MRLLILLLGAFFIFSCSSALESEMENLQDRMNRLETQVEASTIEEYQAPFHLDTAFIQGTDLWIAVSYGGGCEEHEFMVVWPEAIPKIYPPDFSVTVYHKNNTDFCKALILDTLKIDLQDTPTEKFDPATISEMRITVVNGSNPEVQKSTR